MAGLAACLSAAASTFTVTSSAQFSSDLGSAAKRIEDFSGAQANQVIPSGTTLNNITYGPLSLTGGASQLIITDLYDNFSGLTLGVDHTGGDPFSALTYFFGNEGATLTFNTPVYAVGVYYNVNQNSGSFAVATSMAVAMTGSAVFDTPDHDFVFAGIVSDTPFSQANIYSVGTVASYNVAEIIVVTGAPTGVPEPSTWLLCGIGISVLSLWRLRRRSAVALQR